MKTSVMVSRAAGVLLTAAAASAVAPGQIDTFDAASQGWMIGAPGGPTAVTWMPDGGPTGVGDGFVRRSSTGGGGPGARAVIFNLQQWGGDYFGQGIDSIRMDVRNEGATTLFVRVGLWGATGIQLVTNDVEVVAPGTGWQTIELSIDENSFDPIYTPIQVQQTLSNVFHCRIVSSEMQSFNGDAIAAVMDLDNITAGPFGGACPADFNGDLAVDGSDLAILLAAWGTSGADLTGDGNTDGSDLAVLLAAWGVCP